ncbi:MAG: cyanophycin synthetase, partial [Patescibacteria group bacterium]
DASITKAIKKFKPLSHRLEAVGEYKGIKFIDDAISTTPESTIEALRSLKNVKTIFLGGEDRGYDFTNLERELRLIGVENVVLFPDTGRRILSFTTGLRVLKTKSMQEAVKFAYKVTPQGSICLLSTASPSYSVWKNFEEKGDLFKKFVKKYSK